MDELLDLMQQVENPGAFSVGGKLSSIPPGLKVKGVGLIALPFIEPHAKALIKHSEQAPFGRGEETVVDTKVRNVWQISAEDVETSNPEWEKMLQKSVQAIGQALGLGDSKIDAELYKLLVYEKGSFFTPHRDTEKIPNMFATLVISLPSEHEGGELVVSHAGKSETYSFADGDYFYPSFVTFYADCYHEVRPVTSGYRVCLIYNLSIANRKTQPRLLQQDKIINQVGHTLQQWTQQKNEQPILSYLLEHSYSAKNLSLANLKNGDFAKASVLLKAAEENNCEAFLCLITYYRTSYGDTPYYGRYSYHDDDLDEDDFEEHDVDTEETYAHSFISAEGRKKRIDKLYIEEDEILADIPLRDGSGRGYSISEATGNEGATKELWYHRGGIVIWSKDNAFALVQQMDIDYAAHFFQKSVKKNKLTNDNYRQQVKDLASHLLKNMFDYRYPNIDISPQLITLGDIELLKTFVRKKMPCDLFRNSSIEPEVLIPITDTFGWQSFEKILTDSLMARKYKSSVLEWINQLLLVQEIPSKDGQTLMRKWIDTCWRDVLANPTELDIVNTLQLVALLKIDNVIEKILTLLAKQQQPLFLTDTYGPAVIATLKALKGRDYDHAIMQQCVAHVCHWIEKDFSEEPQKPNDWSHSTLLACNCTFCRKVNAFLPDPDRSTLLIDKTLKRNIVHIQSTAEQSGAELNIEIIRVPPKFQGDIKKTQREYEQQHALFTQAQGIAKQLKAAIK